VAEVVIRQREAEALRVERRLPGDVGVAETIHGLVVNQQLGDEGLRVAFGRWSVERGFDRPDLARRYRDRDALLGTPGDGEAYVAGERLASEVGDAHGERDLSLIMITGQVASQVVEESAGKKRVHGPRQHVGHLRRGWRAGGKEIVRCNAEERPGGSAERTVEEAGDRADRAARAAEGVPCLDDRDRPGVQVGNTGLFRAIIERAA